MTPQEAAETAADKALLGFCPPTKPAIAELAIQMYEASHKRVQLTPEQARVFEDKVEDLTVILNPHEVIVGPSTVVLKRAYLKPSFHVDVEPSILTAPELRQFAAVCEALANNLERFPS